MVDFHKLKNLGTDILGRAGDIAEQAKDKVVPLAEQAKDKVAPLAEQAKDKVGPLADKAKGAAAKGVDKAAGGLDSATGHKYHHKLGAVTGNRDKNPTSGPVVHHNETDSDGAAAGVTPEGSVVDGSAEAVTDLAPAESAADDPAEAVSTPAAEPVGAEPRSSSDSAETLTAEHTPTPADMPQHIDIQNDIDNNRS